MSVIGRLVPKITLEIAEWVTGFAKAGKLNMIKQTANVFSRSPGKLLKESKAFLKNAKAKGIQTTPVDIDNAAVIGPASNMRRNKGFWSNLDMEDDIFANVGGLDSGGIHVGSGQFPGAPMGVSSGYWNPKDMTFMSHILRNQNQYHPKGLNQKFPYLLTRKGLKKKPRWEDTPVGKEYNQTLANERKADIMEKQASKSMQDHFADILRRGPRRSR